MKKRIIATFAVLALFALAIAAYAYKTTSSVVTDKACCCAAKDSCPMKGKGHDDKGEHAKMSCCSKHGEDHAKGTDHAKLADHKCCGDSCPMKKKGETSANAVSTSDAHECCGCCGDSCPMKKKDGATAVSSDGKSCCDDCACCKGKTEKSV